MADWCSRQVIGRARGALLHGRAAEKAEIDRLLQALREGGSGALVIAGEVGIGKSALAEDAAEQARGMELLRATGVESRRSCLSLGAPGRVLRPHSDDLALCLHDMRTGGPVGGCCGPV
ncbi:AAA family ATPase [Nonomuraea sp. NPDC052116]|uniref:AAA family ATPase n=1 Tax=Nonomuraea sp. NPDC052116 TaxID=3155665 RepID=UPI003435D51F